ncbi:RNA-binding domain-containing protein [Tilletiaria anomala UBC 951]|uniref:RNA-binding domain-containing protein n=1 Tax=Tilletiaria anomala (strain ATCC 24038 / CBS 436.72 / UBC 951) TaxID=1037660 RepID=A0A066WFY3_TILAU|nr:RNA-binding domain-containing protein [Tilletiaria anomala UBC 951]KDN51428.1 RNA-binding domain-containing protein [Tilletiaria anomala UBC 951]
MASYLASIYGTEQDKVNCSFYYKIGACRHGDRCSRKHTKPPFSQTILISNVYANPKHTDPNCTLSDEQIQTGFDNFFEDWYAELAKYGHLLEMHVCDNVGDHLIGNVYARYEWEEEAQRAVDALNDRWYDNRPLWAELSPVTDFREACCRQNETNECNRGGFCNFMHLRHPTKGLIKQLEHEQAVELRYKKEAQHAAKEAAAGGGWKKNLEEQGAGGWKSAPSGGDWRSGPSSRPVAT